MLALAWPSSHMRVQDLVSPDPDVAMSAVHGLYARSAAGEDVVSDLLLGLSHPDSRVRARCVRMLGNLNANDHADRVAAMLTDPDAYVRVQVGVALLNLRDYEDPSPLLKSLSDRGEWERIRINVATSLAGRREMSARAAFASVARESAEPEGVRIASIRGLGAVRAERDLLVRLASSPSEPDAVRRESLLALSNQEAAEFLRKVATSPDTEEQLRGCAALALARSGAPGTRDLYRSLLHDRQTPLCVRLQAARGVWRMEQSLGGADSLLREGLGSPDPAVRRNAANLARESSALDVCSDLAAALRLERDETTRAVLEEALRKLEPEAIADPDQMLLAP